MTSLEVQEKLGPVLSRIAAGLEGADRVRVSRAMGGEVRGLIVRHLTELGNSRHTTAQRLGARPTGYIAQLAENFDQSSTVAVDADGVSISMRHPVIARALRDITIVPTGGKQFLTIPLNALAYGRRVGEFEKFRLVRQGGDHRGPEGKKDKPYDNSLPAWLLVRSVTQKRDPSLLPTLDEITTAAATGAGAEIKALLTEAQRL